MVHLFNARNQGESQQTIISLIFLYMLLVFVMLIFPMLFPQFVAETGAVGRGVLQENVPYAILHSSFVDVAALQRR